MANSATATRASVGRSVQVTGTPWQELGGIPKNCEIVPKDHVQLPSPLSRPRPASSHPPHFSVIFPLPPSSFLPSPLSLLRERWPHRQQASQTPSNEIITALVIDVNKLGWNSDYGKYVALGQLRPAVSIDKGHRKSTTCSPRYARRFN